MKILALAIVSVLLASCGSGVEQTTLTAKDSIGENGVHHRSCVSICEV